MASELPVQTHIVKSVRKDGGYARKLSNRFTIGIPDLLVALPPFVPCLVEVKDLGVVVDKFHRKLDVTPKQANEMKTFSEPYEEHQHPYTPLRRTACVFVALQHRGEHRLVAVRRDAEALSWEYEQHGEIWCKRQVHQYYPVAPLLRSAGICEIKIM